MSARRGGGSTSAGAGGCGPERVKRKWRARRARQPRGVGFGFIIDRSGGGIDGDVCEGGLISVVVVVLRGECGCGNVSPRSPALTGL